MLKNNTLKISGFTMLELLMVVTIFIILAVVIIATLDPVGVLADARNRQRESDVNALMGIVYRNIADNSGEFECMSGPIPTSTTNMSPTDYDIAPCLVPLYIPELPHDPRAAGAYYLGPADYDLQYSIAWSTSTSRVTISAPHAERGDVIEITR